MLNKFYSVFIEKNLLSSYNKNVNEIIPGIHRNALFHIEVVMATKYERLANILREMIAKNPNERFKLPTEYELCTWFHVSRQTVRKAFSLLDADHLIEHRQGSGYYTTGLLSDQSSNQVALLLSSEDEYIYPSLISDIRNRLFTYNYTLTTYSTNNMVSKEREILKELLSQEKSVRGIIIEGCKTALPTPNADLFDQLHARNISIIFLHGKYPNLSEYPSIEDDNYGGGYYLGKYLASLGHKKIAGIFKSDDIQGILRYHGFLQALYDENASFQDSRICWYDSNGGIRADVYYVQFIKLVLALFLEKRMCIYCIKLREEII